MANILFISTKSDWGGSEDFWSDCAEKAIREGHCVSAVIPQTRELHPRHKELQALGVRLLIRPPRKPLSFLSRIIRKCKGLKQDWEVSWWQKNFVDKPDAICVSQGGSYCALWVPGLIPWLIEQQAPYSVISHSHRNFALPGLEFRSILKTFFRSAKNLFFVAHENLRAASRYLALDLNNASVLQTPLTSDIPDFVPWPRSDILRMACIGRFELIDKGQDLLIDALTAPQWKERDFRLTLYGAGPDRKILEELISLHGFEDKIEFGEFVSDVRQTWRRWETNHLLVLPSLSEGTPIVLIEALLCARPALVTRVDGNGEWVEEGKTGFFAEAPTGVHLRLALERAWENRHRLSEMGEAAKDSCLAKRDPDPVGTLLSALVAVG
jgi:glycosyltransferase involved in cell wall biosynthesis